MLRTRRAVNEGAICYEMATVPARRMEARSFRADEGEGFCRGSPMAHLFYGEK
jgi:hypothetical protein